MVARSPLVLGSDGLIQQLQSADTLAGVSGGSSFSPIPTGRTAVVVGRALTSTDTGKVLDLTGTFGLSGSAATVGAGFGCWFSKRDGSGVVTFTPTSGTIDGRTSISVYQENLFIYSDGTNFYSVGREFGWISLIAETTLGDVTTGFSDLEIQKIELDYRAIKNDTASQLQGKVYKNGAVITGTGYYYANLYVASSSPVAAATTAGFLNMSGGNIGINSTAAGTVEILGLHDTVALNSHVTWRWHWSVPEFSQGGGVEGTTAAVVGGFSLVSSLGGLTGKMLVRGFRG